MAPRGSKRAAPKAPAGEPGAKRVADFLKTHGISKASFQPVVEAVQNPLAELSDDTCNMILAALPWSLAAPADQRRDVQQMIVRMTGEIVEGIQSKLQDTVTSEMGSAEELEGSKSTLEGHAQQAEASAEEASQVVQASKERLAQAAAAQGGKTASLQEAEVAEQRVAAELKTIRSSIADFEDVLANSFVKLRDVSFEESEAEGLVAKVMAMGKACSLEDSLLATLPACLAKRERGAFDQQVLTAAEQTLRQKVSGSVEKATALETQLLTCQTSVAAAKTDLEAAGGAQAEAAEQLQSAEATSAAASTASAEARQAVTEVQVKLAEAQTTLEKSREALDSFKSYNVFMFEMLRDATSKKAEISAEDASMEPLAESQPAAEPSAEPQPAAEPSAEPQPVTEATLDSQPAAEEPASKIPEQAQTGVTETMAVLGA